jgi:hypothetical protein
MKSPSPNYTKALVLLSNLLLKMSKMSRNLRLPWVSCPRNDNLGIFADLIIIAIIVENHMILLMLLNALRDPKL